MVPIRRQVPLVAKKIEPVPEPPVAVGVRFDQKSTAPAEVMVIGAWLALLITSEASA